MKDIMTEQVVNSVDGELMNVVTGANLWRLIYSNGRVVKIFKSSSMTKTHREVFTAPTEAECIAQARVLNLLDIPEPTT